MGLFDKKEPCAICGGKVSGLFPWSIEGRIVCNGCSGYASQPKEFMENLAAEGFEEYMAFCRENALLKQQFQTTQQIDFGLLDDKFLFDTNNRLLCMDKKLKKPVFEGWRIKSFEIREDQQLLFSGSAEGLVRYTSTVTERVMALAPQIEQLRMQIQMRHEMERMRESQKDENGNSVNSGYSSLPNIEIPVPFKIFLVEIHFEHPYWPLFKADKSAPSFDSDEPDVNNYLRSYDSDVQLMEDLARALKEVAFPDAPERTAAAGSTAAAGGGGVSAPGVTVDTVEELKRLKELVDMGILTEEEFTAKKRQVLGI